MNMWGFTPAACCRSCGVSSRLSGIDSGGAPEAEFLLPEVIQSLVREERFRVEVLPGSGEWCGITFPPGSSARQIDHLVPGRSGTLPGGALGMRPSIGRRRSSERLLLVTSLLVSRMCGGLPVTRSSETSAVPVSAGCGAEPPVPPGESAAFSMRVGELDREYVLHLPPGLRSGSPYRSGPRLPRLHRKRRWERRPTPGSAGTPTSTATPSSIRRAPGSPSTTRSVHHLVERPRRQRLPRPEGPICSETADDYPHPPECGEPTPCNWASCHDDLGFIARMLDRLEEELCLDLDRVYATGMSNGGMFVHRLGCEHVRAIRGHRSGQRNARPRFQLRARSPARNDEYLRAARISTSRNAATRARTATTTNPPRP